MREGAGENSKKTGKNSDWDVLHNQRLIWKIRTVTTPAGIAFRVRGRLR
jgi:hypothetical protein